MIVEFIFCFYLFIPCFYYYYYYIYYIHKAEPCFVDTKTPITRRCRSSSIGTTLYIVLSLTNTVSCDGALLRRMSPPKIQTFVDPACVDHVADSKRSVWRRGIKKKFSHLTISLNAGPLKNQLCVNPTVISFLLVSLLLPKKECRIVRIATPHPEYGTKAARDSASQRRQRCHSTSISHPLTTCFVLLEPIILCFCVCSAWAWKDIRCDRNLYNVATWWWSTLWRTILQAV